MAQGWHKCNTNYVIYFEVVSLPFFDFTIIKSVLSIMICDINPLEFIQNHWKSLKKRLQDDILIFVAIILHFQWFWGQMPLRTILLYNIFHTGKFNFSLKIRKKLENFEKNWTKNCSSLKYFFLGFNSNQGWRSNNQVPTILVVVTDDLNGDEHYQSFLDVHSKIFGSNREAPIEFFSTYYF